MCFQPQLRLLGLKGLDGGKGRVLAGLLPWVLWQDRWDFAVCSRESKAEHSDPNTAPSTVSVASSPFDCSRLPFLSDQESDRFDLQF